MNFNDIFFLPTTVLASFSLANKVSRNRTLDERPNVDTFSRLVTSVRMPQVENNLRKGVFAEFAAHVLLSLFKKSNLFNEPPEVKIYYMNMVIMRPLCNTLRIKKYLVCTSSPSMWLSI